MPSSVIGELERLDARGVPFAGAAAKLARRARTVPTRSLGDAALLEAAARQPCWVATGDRALAERLSAGGVGVLRPRGRSGFTVVRAGPKTVKRPAKVRRAR